ncbi:uncharacterized protein F5147DRAFT_658363 [Suillus discolor]|uniref:Uncharacterized protein n=1 Tax=Suillus discolor TaxID=1912936 RepID=A0A9P7EUA3_9AGAM|nr:uncharacterized protein F5147DRAFT_658363 [Suillus discolor]KAG2089607.1 hypothetical protein F5147DRAFT_658363 [Suillus discolor]
MTDQTDPSSSPSMPLLPISPKPNGKGEGKYSEAEAEREEAEEGGRASNLKRIFVYLVIRLALGFSSGLELRSDNWTALLARAEKRSKTYFASSAIVLFIAMLFMVATPDPSTTSTASLTALVVAALSSFGSLTCSVSTIPRIPDVSLIQIKRFVSNESFHAAFPLSLLCIPILFNVVANFALVVALTIMVWEQIFWNHANAPIYMAIPKQMGVPVRIPCEGKDQFEIVQVTVIVEKAVTIIISGCCTRVWTKHGQDSGGELGQNDVP